MGSGSAWEDRNAEEDLGVLGWEIGVSVHFLSFFLKPIDGKLIVEGI